ncbi:peptidoglycan bridge formation glycyltransferase FemA/FemB family protein [Candidatus Woesebacteria bacterium]|nr:peptidoglycan bridge formation glycyltransferase FemA/FemB family protein [Candidatus Woesebacteria bacterium]
MHDLRQDKRYLDYVQSIGWKYILLGKNQCYIKDLFFGLSIVKLQRPEFIAGLSDIKKQVKRYCIVNFLVEPKDDRQFLDLCDSGFKKSKNPSLPTKTIQLDLLKSKKELLSDMHHKARYNIKLSERNGVVIKRSKDIERFSGFWHKASKSWGMNFSQKKEIISLYKAFGKDSIILEAYFKEELIAAALLVNTNDISYYMYAASSEKGNRLHAPSLLVWESIVKAKIKGKKIFDFGGVYDERYPLKKWKGFTEFKRKFGGKIIEYPGPLRKFIFKFG